MKKLLVLLGSIGLTSTAAIGVVACGVNNRSEVVKTNIETFFNDVDLTINGKANMTEDDAFTSFLNIDGISDILTTLGLSQTDFTLNLNFDTNYYTIPGSLTLTVNEQNAKYTGSIMVTIDALGQTNLQNLTQLVKTIDGVNTMTTATQAFNAFLAIPANKELIGLVKVESDENSFIAPTTTKDGSLIVETISGNQPYVGKLSVIISKLIALDTLNLKTSLTSPVVSQEAAFDEFIKLNNAYDVAPNLEIISYNGNDYDQTGSLVVQAKSNTKYSGTLTIMIPKKPKTDLGMLINNQTIQGTLDMTAEQVFDAFLAVNSSWKNLDTFVDYGSYIQPGYGTSGSLEIAAKSNLGYFGTIVVKINALEQTNLATLNLKTTLTSSVTSQEAAFNQFIKLNADVKDLADNLEIISYEASDYDQTGSLVVQAKPNTKYLGTLTIILPELDRIDLSQLINSTTIQGIENMTLDDALMAFAVNNPGDQNPGSDVYWSFVVPTYLENGSLTIAAKANTKYSGQVTIIISKLEQVDLSTLELKTTIGIIQNATQEDAFTAFLKTNQTVFGKSLTRDQVELSGFRSPGITANGALTISVKSGIDSRYSGSITIKINFFLDENNISDMIRYLSDNHLLNFKIPAGTPMGQGNGNLLVVMMGAFRDLMSGVYQYGDNVKTIQLKTYDQSPNQTEINQKGFVWTSPSNMNVWINIFFKDGTSKEIKFSNMNITITMV